MSRISEKVAYLDGLMEGLEIEDAKQKKLFNAIIDALDTIAEELSDHDDAIDFIKENDTVTVRSYKGSPFAVKAPNFVVLEVTETEPGFKGDTATGTTKPAVLETGYHIAVPLFVNQGDKIRVDTRTGEYMERI